jgi:hypothetical protein
LNRRDLVVRWGPSVGRFLAGRVALLIGCSFVFLDSVYHETSDQACTGASDCPERRIASYRTENRPAGSTYSGAGHCALLGRSEIGARSQRSQRQKDGDISHDQSSLLTRHRRVVGQG